MQEIDCFFDCYHHMFTIADVPIYQTIRQAAHDNLSFIKRATLTPLLSFYLPLFNATDKVAEYEKFMRFFENEPVQNVEQIVNEVLGMLEGNDGFTPPFTVNGHNILLTPLVMDMDLNSGEGDRALNKLPSQIERLCNAIDRANCRSAKVLPFVGIDPRRKKGLMGADGVPTLDHLLSLITPLRTLAGGLSAAQNGSIIGIKLYPSLGFKPQEAADLCMAAASLQIPITVHCQNGSLKLVNKGDDLNHPANWEPVLSQVHAAGKNPIINFAHFGGEDEVLRTILFQKNDGSYPAPPYMYDGQDIDEDSWTYRIIRMLKKYPGTYADLSAFDFVTSGGPTAALHWLINMDRNGAFGDGHLLEDRLLWGSDYPMTLKKGKVTYSKLFQEFVIAASRKDDSAYQYPDMNGFDASAFIIKAVCTNPKSFLGAL